MINDGNIEIDTGIPTNAVSVIGDNAEEFPVLKAFQQYIDAEQNKARKRMLSLCIFFGFLMTVVIVVFVFLLNGISARNQALNDRMIEYVLKDRERSQAAVVVQPPTDQSAVYTLTAKIDEMQKKLVEAQQKADAAEQARADKAAQEAAIAAAKEKARIKEQIEIQHLKAELAAEREKAAAEKERKHQEEIEAYRRKHYPELYEKKPAPLPPSPTSKAEESEEAVDAEINALASEHKNLLQDLQDEAAITYFEEDDENGKPLKKDVAAPTTTVKPASYSIPVEVKGTRSKFRIPNN